MTSPVTGSKNGVVSFLTRTSKSEISRINILSLHFPTNTLNWQNSWIQTNYH